MTEAAPPLHRCGGAAGTTALTDVFVSYAREDHEFVVGLCQALGEHQLTGWVDWEGIPPSAEWMHEIEQAIVRAQSFVFVVSDDSAASAVCAKEVELADRHNKKIIPLVARAVDPAELPAAVAARQWIDAQEPETLPVAMAALVSAVYTDLDWNRMHTRLLDQAVRWHDDKERTSLLEGRELEDAEAWLGDAAGHETQPTPQQVAYIEASRWRAQVHQAHAHYEQSVELVADGRRQAACAHLLRAVELAPPGAAPPGYVATGGEPDWGEEAWTAFRHLDAERGRLVARLRAAAPVSCLALHADEPMALVGTSTGAVELWAAAEGRRVATLGDLHTPIAAVAYAPSGEWLAASADGLLHSWSAVDGPPRVAWRSSGNPVTAIGFGPRDERAFGTRDGTVVVRDAAGKELLNRRMHNGSVTAIAFLDDGRTMATSSGRPPTGDWLAEGVVATWDFEEERQRHLIAGVMSSPLAVALSPDGGTIVRSVAGGVVDVYPAGDLRAVARHRLSHGESVRALAFFPDSERVATGAEDGVVRIWDLANGKELRSLDGHLGPVTCLVASTDGAMLSSGSLDGSVAVWDLADPAHAEEVGPGSRAIAVSSDAKVAYGDREGSIRILDGAAGPVVRELAATRSGIFSVAITADGETVHAGKVDGTMEVWHAPTGVRRAVLSSPADVIWDVAIGADGATVAGAADDGAVRVWDVGTAEVVVMRPGHDGIATGVAFAAEGLISCGDDGAVRLWSGSDGRLVREVGRVKEVLACVAVAGSTVAAGGEDGRVYVFDSDGRSRRIRAHRGMVRRVALDATGTRLLTASLDGTASYWDAQRGTRLATFARHGDEVLAVAFGPEGTAYSGGRDGLVWVWRLDSGEPLGSYPVSREMVSCLALGAGGATMVAGSLDGSLQVWDTEHGMLRTRLQFGHLGPVDGLSFSPDGGFLASTSRDGTLRLWDLARGWQVARQAVPVPPTSVAWYPGKLAVLCGSGDKQELVEGAEAFGAAGGRSVRQTFGKGGTLLWDFHQGEPRYLERHHGTVWDVAVGAAPDLVLVSAGEDGTLRLWDPATGGQVRFLEGHRAAIWAVAVAPGGRLLASASIDNDVRLWDLESGETLWVFEGHHGGVGSLAFDGSGHHVVSASQDGTIRMVDVAAGTAGRVLRGLDAPVAVAIDPASTRVVAGNLDGELAVWDLAGDEGPHRRQAHQAAIWSTLIGPDGRTAVTTAEDGLAKVWDLATLEPDQVLTDRNVPLNKAALSPDGAQLAAGCADYAVRLWDLSSGERTAILTGHWAEAVSVAYDPAGSAVVSGAADGSVRVWAVGEEGSLGVAGGRTGDVMAAVFDADGTRVLVGGEDGSLRLWDPARGTQLAELRGHTAPVTGLAFHPDGRRAASCSMDASVRLWDLDERRELAVLEGHRRPVLNVLLDGDGTVVVSASTDGTVRAWSFDTGRLLRTVAVRELHDGFDLTLANELGATVQLAMTSNEGTALARDLESNSVLVGSFNSTDRVHLVRPDTPVAPPDPAATGPGSFDALYRSVGLMVARGGGHAGELELV